MLLWRHFNLLLWAGILSIAGVLRAAPPDHNPAPLDIQLNQRVSANWQGQNLGSAIERISSAQGVAIWLDRRVDNEHQVDAHFTDAPLRTVLDTLATANDMGWSPVGDIVYCGPRDSASEIATLIATARDSLERVPANARRRWLDARPTDWPRLSRPRQILRDWLGEVQFNLKNPEALDHDLWESQHLPPTPLVDRVVLLLAGFDLTCDIAANGESCRIVPIQRPVLITREYQPGNRLSSLVAEFKDNALVSFNRKGGRVAVTGRWEDHELIMSMLSNSSATKRQRQRSPAKTKQVFSLKLENQPVGKIVDQLASELGLNVEWNLQLLNSKSDPRATPISCDILNGSLHELLEGVLAPAGFTFVLSGKQLDIKPAE